ncbi:Predicted thiol-disulfide oxidoreductase YuxK, DCC family [Ferrimonas sediminum]|uniref:Predicted thiol-disulfide oxidoreductase YuxK, DCC family n=1 Tax=Ferrimonas sediminum TaxID=718193 RepID=A0A1G8M7B2_9GAMM|nr:DUF393 domain-containing protein [Ferrimonas sediminum]SDI63822.1 Predicted thiol-disulfide oxidoreductase YuxK, DCC family [Ferrimonas sediminum]
MTFTLFIDDRCPLCSHEVSLLRQRDPLGRLRFVSIYDSDWHSEFPQIDPMRCLQVLHAVNERGQVITGLDVTVGAWQRVGRGHLVSWLRWPLIRTLSDWGYLRFAKHRHRISAWLMDAPHCDGGQCSLPPKSRR